MALSFRSDPGQFISSEPRFLSHGLATGVRCRRRTPIHGCIGMPAAKQDGEVSWLQGRRTRPTNLPGTERVRFRKATALNALWVAYAVRRCASGERGRRTARSTERVQRCGGDPDARRNRSRDRPGRGGFASASALQAGYRSCLSLFSCHIEVATEASAAGQRVGHRQREVP